MTPKRNQQFINFITLKKKLGLPISQKENSLFNACVNAGAKRTS